MKIKKRELYTTLEDLVKNEAQYKPKESYAFDYKNAADILRKAMQEKQQITIVGDYDCDGISASAIMFLLLKYFGVEAKIRLPLRFAEGYGLSEKIIDEIDDGLVFTVDNGIAANAAIKKAKAKGLTVVVTDHHLPNFDGNGNMVLPEADCIIDPHIEEISGKTTYGFYDYCGAGIALKFAEELLPRKTDFMVEIGLLPKLYSIAAVATVADRVPVKGDNKNIVIKGLQAIADGKTTAGLFSLFKGNKIDVLEIPTVLPAHHVITADKIGFKIAPCINAPARMVENEGTGRFDFVSAGGDGAKISLKCLLSDDDTADAAFMAKVLLVYNTERQKLTDRSASRALAAIKDEHLEKDCPIVVYVPEMHPGIIGIVAARIDEIFGVPAVVVTGEGVCTGSCRVPEMLTDRGVHMKKLLDEASQYLVRYGGHKGAAGLSVEKDKIGELRDALQKAYKKLYADVEIDLTPVYDFEIDAKDVPYALSTTSDILSPYGADNPEPIFLVRNFQVDEIRTMAGKSAAENEAPKHMKLCSGDVSALLFNVDTEKLLQEIHVGDSVDFLCTLNYNTFRGEVAAQIMVQQLVSPDIEPEEYLL